jgi:hypothetical protein
MGVVREYWKHWPCRQAPVAQVSARRVSIGDLSRILFHFGAFVSGFGFIDGSSASRLETRGVVSGSFLWRTGVMRMSIDSLRYPLKARMVQNGPVCWYERMQPCQLLVSIGLDKQNLNMPNLFHPRGESGKVQVCPSLKCERNVTNSSKLSDRSPGHPPPLFRTTRPSLSHTHPHAHSDPSSSRAGPAPIVRDQRTRHQG